MYIYWRNLKKLFAYSLLEISAYDYEGNWTQFDNTENEEGNTIPFTIDTNCLSSTSTELVCKFSNLKIDNQPTHHRTISKKYFVNGTLISFFDENHGTNVTGHYNGDTRITWPLDDINPTKAYWIRKGKFF